MDKDQTIASILEKTQYSPLQEKIVWIKDNIDFYEESAMTIESEHKMHPFIFRSCVCKEKILFEYQVIAELKAIKLIYELEARKCAQIRQDEAVLMRELKKLIDDLKK